MKGLFGRLELLNVISETTLKRNIMTKIIDLDFNDAKKFFLSAKSYFRQDFPPYISFQPILDEVQKVLGDRSYTDFQKSRTKAKDLPGVNYQLIANKDGRFGWRPFELIHPAIYVSLVNLVCDENNWIAIAERFKEMGNGIVTCCGHPIVPEENQTEDGAQILNWWLQYEQKSLELSLEYTHILQTDVTDCYGSLYTHSISWALHGFKEGKTNRRNSLLGNKIDRHIQDSRHGQTNGIVQGSVLMDIVAELVLGFVDCEISKSLGKSKLDKRIKILRYRDDYRIFAKNDSDTEIALKAISDSLRLVGMKLGAAKTSSSTNIVEASIKPEKLAAIQLSDMDITQAKTMQKQLLRLHAFARKYPNSGALNRLASDAFEKIRTMTKVPNDLPVQIAIVADIAAISPQAFPALSGVLAKLISLAPATDRTDLWEKVAEKMKTIPYNGYLEIWLQRVTKAKGLNTDFESDEEICKIVNGEDCELWNNSWINNGKLLEALAVMQLKTGSPEQLEPIPAISETSLFKQYAEFS